METDGQEPVVVPLTKTKKFKTPGLSKIIIALLVICLATSIFMWKPWQPNIKASDRTISVTGDATIKSEPDEFVFYPTYSFTNADKQAALAQVSQKSDEITAKLKALGVPSSKIKTDSSGYGQIYYAEPSTDNTYNLSFTITVRDKTLSQKVQDYLLTTSPSGSVSPSGSFSTAKQKTLENQARDKAEQDARAKADQSAKNLGFKVTKVKTVKDDGFGGYGGCGPNGLCSGANLSAMSSDASTKLEVQPGENELSYSVSVVYYIR